MASQDEEDEEAKRRERRDLAEESGCCLIEFGATVTAGCLALAWIIPLLMR